MQKTRLGLLSLFLPLAVCALGCLGRAPDRFERDAAIIERWIANAPSFASLQRDMETHQSPTRFREKEFEVVPSLPKGDAAPLRTALAKGPADVELRGVSWTRDGTTVRYRVLLNTTAKNK